MYVNKIDELIDTHLDNFYAKYVRGNKLFERIEKEQNFVKHQLKINSMIEEYVKTIEIKSIKALVNNEDNVIRIIEIIKRYIAYYIFLFMGFLYQGSRENYINNIVEYTKNQSSYTLKITNFFNSENNANIIKFYDLIKNIEFVINIPDAKNSILVTPKGKLKYQDAIDFLNELGQTFIDQNIKLTSKAKTEEIFTKAHNLIKTIVFKELYLKQEKIDVFKILDEIEKEQGEYKYIDIVIPKTEYIDFTQIENLLTLQQVKQGLAVDIYEFLTEYQEIKDIEDIVPPEQKIMLLLESRLVVPIVDDFLRYHKDTEKYEKEKESFEDKKKKKEDTKIRFIVSKIDSISDLFSESTRKNVELKKTIEKMFYAPLQERKAVLINDTEEVKIINKLLNLGRKVIESNEYYLDLLSYRQYPYINFKEFQDYGISLTVPSNTYSPPDVVRYSSFEYKEITRNQPLQLRIGSKDQVLNLVGLMINSSVTPLACLKTGHVLNIRSVKTKDKKDEMGREKSTENGYDGMMKYLKHVLFKNKKHYPSVYWKFDLTKDKITLDKYEQLSKVNSQEQLKLILSKFYDDLLGEVYNFIYSKINKQQFVTFYDGFKILQKYQKKLLTLPVHSDFYKNFVKMLFYEKYVPGEKRYDINEDKFPGLQEDVIKLPSFETKKKVTVISGLEVESTELIIPEDESYYVTALCQHNITWAQINELRKQNPNRFQALLFEFIQQYVIENRDQDYICKSCNNLLNIKKFIVDGAFDDDQGKYVLFSMPMEIPLEDMPEYEKYNRAIKTIEDKLLEKICSILSVSYYVGSTTNIKWRRRAITKTVLDLVLVHNKAIKKTYVQRNEEAFKMYNIQKDFSNLFVFDLDNSIFVYSSKDKDYYKQIKFNNVLTYLLFSLMLEINENQIYSFTEDKVCNWYWFEKFGFNLFANMKIIKNRKLDLAYIQDYKILCYVLYYISCMFSKHRIWNYEYEEDQSKKKQTFHPTVQKTIIHTTLNLINSILEMNVKKKKNYIYEIVSTKFFLKLKTVYGSEPLAKRLAEKLETTVKNQVLAKKRLESKVPFVILPGVYVSPVEEFLVIPKELMCRPARFTLRQKREQLPRLLEMSTISNCPTGTFHQWRTQDSVVVCSVCQLSTDELKSENPKKIVEKYKMTKLDKLSQQYCPDGEGHEFDTGICHKCKKIEYDIYTPYELEQLEASLEEKKDKKTQSKLDQNELEEDVIKEREEKFEKIMENLSAKMKPGDPHEQFLKNIESIIGKDTSYNNIYLRENAYIIDHDHLGNEIIPPIITTDKETQFIFKENQPFFKTNVIYYTNKKIDTDIFYDANTHILLGYRELNKEFVKTQKKSSLYLKINYSIQDRLSQIGFPSRYINVSSEISELKKYFKDDVTINKKIIGDLGRERVQRLKKMVTDLQRVFNLIKYTVPQEEKELNKLQKFRSFAPPSKLKEVKIEDIIKKYQKSLSGMILTKNNKKIFRQWKIIINRLFYSPASEKELPKIGNNYVSVSDIVRVDHNGNLLLFYIVTELNRLIDYNQNKFIKLNIVHMILDLINYTYDLYNIEQKMAIHDIKRFKLILEGSKFIIDIEKKGLGLEADVGVGLYSEDVRPEDLEDEETLDQLETDQEMFDAVDMDTKFDYEQDIQGYYGEGD